MWVLTEKENWVYLTDYCLHIVDLLEFNKFEKEKTITLA